MILTGPYGGNPSAGRIPLSDGVGEVTAVGDGVSRIKIGDRVAGIFFQDWLDGGIEAAYHKSAPGGAINDMFAEYVTLSENGVVSLPEYFDL